MSDVLSQFQEIDGVLRVARPGKSRRKATTLERELRDEIVALRSALNEEEPYPEIEDPDEAVKDGSTLTIEEAQRFDLGERPSEG